MRKTIKAGLVVLSFLSILLMLCSKNPSNSGAHNEKGRTDNGNFVIIFPRADDRINIDSAIGILWGSSKKIGDTASVRISLYKDSVVAAIIAVSTPNIGAYVYIPKRIGSGNNYRIKISALPDTSKYDFSGYFSLYSDYSGAITITYPTTGSRLMIDSSDTVRWKTTEFPGPRLRLDLYCDTSFVSTIVEGMYTTLDKYPWHSISTPLGTRTNYRIKATSENDEALFGYGGYFTIASIYSGGFTITSPTRSTEWPSGYSYSILWDTTGNPGPSVSLRLYADTTFILSIAASALNNGKYLWASPYGMTTDSVYRIKIISARDAGLFAFSPPFTMTGIAADRYEPDNKRSSAHALTLGTTENHTITWNDTDWVRFAADSGASYIIQSKCANLFQIQCALFPDTGSAYIAANSSLALAWMWPCVKNGKYYARIVSAVAANSGEYSFKISRFDPATLAAFTAPLASSKITAGASTTISWVPDSVIFGSSVLLYLYKGSKPITAISSASLPNSGSYQWAAPLGFLSGVDYSLRIVNATDDRFYGQGPVFSINGMAPDQFEPDDSRDRASALTMGAWQEHSLSCNDTDWIRFSAVQGTRYILLLSCSRNLQAAFTMFPDTGKQTSLTAATTAQGSLSTMWTCPASALYYGCITAASGAGSATAAFGAYTVKALLFDSLTSVQFTAPTTGAILVTGGPATISWVPDSIILGDSVSIYLCKGITRLSLLTATCPSSLGSYAWTIADTLKPGADYRIRISNTSKPSYCGFSAKFTLSDVKPDDFESDGTPDKASLAGLDSMQRHTITYNDTDCIRFSADSGSQYLLSANGAAQFRVAGTLYSISSVLPVFALAPNSGGQSNNVWPCVKSGVYYVKITASSPGATGAYSFKVSVFNPETIASFIDPAAGAVWPVDSARTLRWNPSIDLFGASVALYLYEGGSQLIPIIASTANNSIFTWNIPSGLASGNDYRIKLASYGNESLYGLSPVFTLKGMPGDAYEPDNSWNQAHGYTLGTTELHNITYNDTDLIKFAADSGAAYFVRVNGANAFRTTIAFYYENNWNGYDPYVSDASGAIVALWRCVKSGTAYARINASTSTLSLTGAYSFAITKFDSSKSVVFVSPKAAASFASGGAIPVEWTPDTSFLGSAVSITLFKGNKAVMSSAYVENTGKTDFSIATATMISGADYRLQIANFRNNGFYGFSPSFSISGVDAVPDGYEVDNTPDKARTIGIGAPQQHNFIFNDTDWIQLQIAAGARYILMGNRSAGSDIFVNVRYGSSTAAPSSFQFSNNSNNFRTLTPASTSGPCFIELMAAASNIYSAYTFKVLQYDSSIAMKVTSPAAGTVIKSGQNTVISWVGDSSIFGQYVSLYLYNGNTVVGTYLSNNTGSFTWNAAGVVSGSNYRIKIVGSSDTMFYAFSPLFAVNGVDVDAYEPDNTPSQASVLTPGIMQQRNLVLNDTDWIKIAGDGKYKYLFEYTADQSLWINVQLYDSANASKPYSYLLSDNYMNGNTTISLWTCKTSGTYYVRVAAFTSSYNAGNYTVKVTQYDTSLTAKISSPAAGQLWTANAANTVIWTPDADLFGSKVNISLFKNYRYVVAEYGVPNTGSYSWVVPFYVENGSDYRVNISRYDAGGVTGSYSPNFTITGGLVADSYEPDNVQSNAALLTLGEVQRHTLAANDTDWVKFQADSGATYTIQDSTTSTRLQRILFYSNSGAWVKFFEIDSGASTAQWLCDKTGTYYLCTTVYSSMFGVGTPGTYSIKMTKP